MRELAERSGLNESTIFRTEKGTRQPRPKTVEAILAALDPDMLARWEDNVEFYKESVRGFTWPDPDETPPTWILWVEEKENAIGLETI